MNGFIKLTLLFTITAMLLFGVSVSAAKLPTATSVPECLGVNLHCTHWVAPYAGLPVRALDRLQDVGGIVRTDFFWDYMERKMGVYDFTDYDQLVTELKARGMHPLFILSYDNPNYPNPFRSEKGRDGFAKWAAAVAKHYRNDGVIWELYNEPNGGYASAEEYMYLASAVLPAMREADPDAYLIAPASASVGLEFLEECFKRGLLNMVDAVSYHPYGGICPEDNADGLAKIRRLTAKYSKNHKEVTVVSSEWGYSTAGMSNDDIQGEYVPRMFLTNMSLGVPFCVWYQWVNAGTDRKNYEANFGALTADYQAKPGYHGMRQLASALYGMSFIKRLNSSSSDYILLFGEGNRYTIAAWTTGDTHTVTVAPGISAQLGATPVYIPVPSDSKAMLSEASVTTRVESTWLLSGSSATNTGTIPEFVVKVKNPFTQSVTVVINVRLDEGISGKCVDPTTFMLKPGEEKNVHWIGAINRVDKEEYPVSVSTSIGGANVVNKIVFRNVNPIKLRFGYCKNRQAAVIINPSEGTPVSGTLLVSSGTRTLLAGRFEYPGGNESPVFTPNNGTASPIIECTGPLIFVALGKGVSTDNLQATLRMESTANGHPITTMSLTTAKESVITPDLIAIYAKKAPEIDGVLSDWKGALPIILSDKKLVAPPGTWKGLHDMSATGYLMYDSKYLYLACDVIDDIQFNDLMPVNIWQGDSIQIAAGNNEYPFSYTEAGFGLSSTCGTVNYKYFGEDSNKPINGLKLCVKRNDGETIYEMAIPLEAFKGINLYSGSYTRFSLLVNDRDSASWDRKWIALKSPTLIAGVKTPDGFPVLFLKP